MGRLSADIIKKGGYKLSALEIEQAILQNDLVSECCVFGIDDEKQGEEILALIILKDQNESNLIKIE